MHLHRKRKNWWIRFYDDRLEAAEIMCKEMELTDLHTGAGVWNGKREVGFITGA